MGYHALQLTAMVQAIARFNALWIYGLEDRERDWE
jgi:hypothetical protein